jgi:DNA-binding response OmpR family regulator
MARVLIVEDDQDSRDFFADAVALDRHEVALAENADDAERLIRTGTPDVAIIDLFLPGRSGLALIERLRAHWPSVRIIAVTAGWSRLYDDILDEAVRLGADAKFRKPVDAGELRATIKSVLEISGEERRQPTNGTR